MTTIAVFVDVQNVYYTVRQQFGCHFDYSAFMAELAARGDIALARAYAIDRDDPKQRQFQQILRNLGFTVKLKPFIRRADGSAKGDWDVGITIDVLEHAGEVDTVVLASGDGDFELLVARIRRAFGTHVVVYGVAALTAGSLIDAADEFRPIDDRLLLRRG